ncbi:protein ImuA [Paucibacter oligotrophus]|uniref:Protein ImuA n=1 Tax=Roseateles oligotrophus TaxID=1769250 RepID=A0A840L6Q8_9BURK|nr:translesion DNA synthesis-associated protein ImuA [Roseateles oligotrophus]MBB4842372.1 protein ImuA [Roseateles oligotrophus]
MPTSPASCPAQPLPGLAPSAGSPGLSAQALHAQLWRASHLSSNAKPCVSSGFAALDAELPGKGWPTHGLSEILQHTAVHLEWRLLAPALRTLLDEPAQYRPLLLINPPLTPNLPGLQASGLPARQLVWIQADSPQQQLWATEQAIKANAAAAVLAWLPRARPEQIRRLQSHAQASSAPVFLLRPLNVQAQSSAAPLRLALRPGRDWCLHLHILKRRGPCHEGEMRLQALPAGLQQLLTPRMLSQPWPPRPALAPRTETTELRHALARPALTPH